MIVIGANVSNAFAEAPTANEHLYIEPDEIFRDWWENHKKPSNPSWLGTLYTVCISRHPEAPRPWEHHIDNILQTCIHLKSTHHEPCLYSGTVQGTYILLSHQVDDFAVGVTSEDIGHTLIDNIDQYFRIHIKYQGHLQMLNGMDIVQTRDYIKIHCGTYLRKALGNHRDLIADTKSKTYPVPYLADHDYTTILSVSTTYYRIRATKT
jgi:hypothetical protein